jgi:hypothetical protein
MIAFFDFNMPLIKTQAAKSNGGIMSYLMRQKSVREKSPYKKVLNFCERKIVFK